MDWIAGLFEILAKIIVGHKNKYGWILHLIAGGLWTYVALATKVYGLLIITIPAVFINIWNFIKWCRQDNKNKKLTLKQVYDTVCVIVTDINSNYKVNYETNALIISVFDENYKRICNFDYIELCNIKSCKMFYLYIKNRLENKK